MKDFEILYRQYYQPIFKFLMKMTGNYEIAEELTQETFYQAFLSITRFRGRSSFYTWLCSIAKNAYFSHLKKKKDIPMNIDILLENTEDRGMDIQRAVEQKELREFFRKELLKLNKKQRDVMVLRIYAEMAYKDIAALLNITEDHAKVLFFRGKQELKNEINRYYSI